MQARVVSIINCGLENPLTKGVCTNGSLVHPDTFCEVANKNIVVYTTEVDIDKGLFDVKCGQTGCEFYGGGRRERMG